VRRLLDAGAIGKVAFAKVRSSHGGPASWAFPTDPTWFYQLGAGPLFDLGVYGIHTITALLGPARRVTAFSGITEPTRTVEGIGFVSDPNMNNVRILRGSKYTGGSVPIPKS
jgi:predicted dehydrogenase